MSGIGKGIVVSSVAALLIEAGIRLTIKKLDPYLNVDAGTMNPFEHGETYVTRDGLEADLDLGHYECFTGTPMNRNSIITSGKIYTRVFENERKGDYLGKTVQMIPHVTDEIRRFVMQDADKYDLIMIEIGGTIGDIESMIYYETIRQMVGMLGRKNVVNIHLTYVPFLRVSEEYKTKPAQDSIKKLMQSGIQPDIIMCRFEDGSTDADFISKISMFSNVKRKNIFLAPNIDNIYKIPHIYSEQGVHRRVLRCLRFKYAPPSSPSRWEQHL